MIDPTEYDPNSKDITDDPDFVDFVGDNDHGDDIPEPKCGVCGVPWASHMGIMGGCLCNRALEEDLKDSLEAHDEMRLEIVRLTKERDEARREVCLEASTDASGCYISGKHILVAEDRGWDCFKENTQAMNNIAKLDEELGL